MADLSLETPEDDADEFDEAGRVVLSTIHSSKGLEWDAVILLDLVEDRFPSRHALVRPEDFEEERRLMYVACTRAREDLELFVPATLYSRQNGGNEPRDAEPLRARTARSAPLRSGRRATRAASPSAAHPSPEIPPFRGLLWIFPANWPTPTPGASKACSRPRSSPRRKAIGPHPRAARGAAIAGIRYSGAARSWNSFRPTKCRVNFPGFGLKVILSAFLTLEE